MFFELTLMKNSFNFILRNLKTPFLIGLGNVRPAKSGPLN